MDDELLNEFVNESKEHLATIEADLLTIEEGGENIDEVLVNKVFRAAHSIKGGSGFFGLTKVKELAHKAETLLDMLRSRTMVPNAEVTNVLLAAFDKLREMICNPAESENVSIEELVVSLTGLASSYLPGEKKAALTQQATIFLAHGGPGITVERVDLERVQRNGLHLYAINLDLIHDVERQGKNVLQIFRDLGQSGEILDCAIDFEAAGTLENNIGSQLPLRLIYATAVTPEQLDTLFTVGKEKMFLLMAPGSHEIPTVGICLTDLQQQAPAPSGSKKAPPASPPAQVQPAAPESGAIPEGPKAEGKAASAAGGAAPVEETLRVNVGLLENLMNLAGELVLSRNQLRSAVAQDNSQSIGIADQRINQVTSELQDVIMQTRLQPIGNVFAKFPRVVRDLSMSLGKDIVLDIRGKDVALDKSLIEGLSDPLTHMIRNAVDHGVETIQERQHAGKNKSGLVRIEAKHEAGHVVVEIEDDGKGIDPKKVADSAIAKGLISKEKLQAMNERDKQALIFLPGLSTSQKVSDVSGRGVGMDVVKTNLDRLGGKVEISSVVGKGSLFRIKLPLTLAIIPSLIISVGTERFAIPQANINELLRLRAEDVKNRIEVVGNSEVLVLRDEILPLVRFGEVLEVEQTFVDPVSLERQSDRRKRLADRRSPKRERGKATAADEQTTYAPRSDGRRTAASSALEIAVLNTGTLTFGLVVDSFHDTEEIVVKPLGRHLKGLREYAGATILGDGAVALIVDSAGLAMKIGLTPLSGTERANELANEAEQLRKSDVCSIFLFYNGADEPCALPLENVQRIERIRAEQVEEAGGRRSMQYRGESLPLVTLADTARVKPLKDDKVLAVLVSSMHGRDVGLLGAMPVDVIETSIKIDQLTHRQQGIAGSAIVNGQTTLIADLFELVETAYPEWGQARADLLARSTPAGSSQKTVLLAEDSAFFRAQVKKILESDGFNVLDAQDGEDAWEMLDGNPDQIDIVVTDIEMPRLNGLDLARRIRADQRTASLPIIAVTSLAGGDDISKGRAAGINDYQIKLDRDQLLASVHAAAAAVHAQLEV